MSVNTSAGSKIASVSLFTYLYRNYMIIIWINPPSMDDDWVE